MAPVPTAILPGIKEFHAILNPAVKELNTILRRIGFENCPGYDDEVDVPGENGPGGGIGEGGSEEGPTSAQRNGILLVLMMFGFLAVMFTIVVGWVWCVSANEPTYYPMRKESLKTKRVVSLRDWYRRRRNLQRTKSNFSCEEDYNRILAFLSTRNWRSRIPPQGEPDDHNHTHWKRRPNDTLFWREHGHKGAFSPRSPLMSERGKGGGGYSTFSKEGGANIEINRVGMQDTDEGPPTSIPFLPLSVRVPPLRRPPLKGRTASLSNGSASPDNGERKLYKEQRSHSWGGCRGGGGGHGRPWGGSGRGNIRSSRGIRSSIGIRPRGLDVVVEEALPAAAAEK